MTAVTTTPRQRGADPVLDASQALEVSGISPPVDEHRLTLKVYLEDTDAQGIVYHSNYLKYCERGRTEILADRGFLLGSLQEAGLLFVVYEMRLKFHRPARLHDVLEVRSTAKRTSDYRITFNQAVHLAGVVEPLFTAEVHVVAIGPEGGLQPIPKDILA